MFLSNTCSSAGLLIWLTAMICALLLSFNDKNKHLQTVHYWLIQWCKRGGKKTVVNISNICAKWRWDAFLSSQYTWQNVPWNISLEVGGKCNNRLFSLVIAYQETKGGGEPKTLQFMTTSPPCTTAYSWWSLVSIRGAISECEGDGGEITTARVLLTIEIYFAR